MEFNNIPSNRPMIQESQSMMNNGGGGNTGYFQRGRKKQEEKSQNLWDETDKLELSTQENENNNDELMEEKDGFGYKLLDKMKKFFK